MCVCVCVRVCVCVCVCVCDVEECVLHAHQRTATYCNTLQHTATHCSTRVCVCDVEECVLYHVCVRVWYSIIVNSIIVNNRHACTPWGGTQIENSHPTSHTHETTLFHITRTRTHTQTLRFFHGLNKWHWVCDVILDSFIHTPSHQCHWVRDTNSMTLSSMTLSSWQCVCVSIIHTPLYHARTWKVLVRVCACVCVCVILSVYYFW